MKHTMNGCMLLLPAILLIAGCRNTLVDRSLVFATHTTVGIELSVTPSEATSPVSIVMGYKRYEGVLNPVFYDHNAVETYAPNAATRPAQKNAAATQPIDKFYRTDAYSIIAVYKNDSSTGSGTANARMGGGQWFATGKASEILARQAGIAGAVSGNSGVAQGAAAQELAKQATAAFIVTTDNNNRANAAAKAELDAILDKNADAENRVMTLASTLFDGKYAGRTYADLPYLMSPAEFQQLLQQIKTEYP